MTMRWLTAAFGFALAACGEGTAPVGPISTLFVQAPIDSLFVGRSMRVGAVVATDSARDTATAVAWSSSDTSVIVIDSAGSALAVGPGRASIRATVRGLTAQQVIYVVLARADGGVRFTEGSASDIRSCAIASGAVYCRAVPTAADSTPLFVQMPGAAGISFAAVEGSLHAVCGLTSDGRILCWGFNAHFLFARSGTVTTDTGPVAVRTTRRFSSFTHGGHSQSCGIDRVDSVAYCWGHNDAYQLGRSPRAAEDSVVAPVEGAIRASVVRTANFSTCLLDLAGAAHCSGGLGALNRQLLGIDETRTPAERPLPVIGGVIFRSISAADQGACGLTLDNDAYCWGNNSSGQLGIGSLAVAPTGPQRVLGGLKFSLLTTVYRESTCGITLGGDLYCWGRFAPVSLSSRLGDRAFQPYPLMKGIKFKAFTRGVATRSPICGLTTDGRMYCWD